MDMKLVNTIRNYGWPDRYGQWRYGNAAVLCFLSSHKALLADINPKKGSERGESHRANFAKDSINTQKEGDCYRQPPPFPLL